MGEDFYKLQVLHQEHPLLCEGKVSEVKNHYQQGNIEIQNHQQFFRNHI